jgi:hypothetical protein
MSNVFLHPSVILKWPWAQFPTIEAPHPLDRARLVRLQVSPHFIIGNLRKNLRSPIYQAWAHLVGRMPPVPNVNLIPASAALSLTTLKDAHACFRGVKRPHGSELNGDRVFIYLIKVAVTVRFDNTPPVGIPATQPLDPDIVLAVYVESIEGLQSVSESLWGAALRLEFVEMSTADLLLPVDHESRYDERLW